MANIIKIDNALIKRHAHKKKKEAVTKEIVAYFLIVCEGEKTEPNYFRAFPKQAGKVIYDLQIEGGGISTLRVVEKAIELRAKSSQKYDRVWAVFDKDSFKSNSFNSAILKAKANNIYCAWSNQAFELWYLLHFHNRVTAMDRSEYEQAIEQAINEQQQSKNKFRYTKNAPNMYHLLLEKGNQQQAIKRAKKLNELYGGEAFANYNPATQVYQLVEELNGASAQLQKEITQKYLKGE